MADSQLMINMIQTGYLSKKNVIFLKTVSQIKKNIWKKCVCNTQNYIKMATNNGYIIAFYIAFMVHIIQVISTILQNEQSTNLFRKNLHKIDLW